MIPVVFPGQLNWFHHRQALSIAEDLGVHGVQATPVAAQSPIRLGDFGGELVLLVSFAESLEAAERSGVKHLLLRALGRFKRRILVNFDSIRSPWFAQHFSEGKNYFSEVLDVGLFRQVPNGTVVGVPYRFVPEAFSAADAAAIVPWSAGRPLPWTVLGHVTEDRAALIEAVLRCMPKNGFVFSPPLRPFTGRSGLDYDGVCRVLGQTDLYIWGSHHQHPYHETQRALNAVVCGTVPVKIDPLHHDVMAMIPWVYPSLEAFLTIQREYGLAHLFSIARAFLEQQGSLGRNMKAAIHHD